MALGQLITHTPSTLAAATEAADVIIATEEIANVGRDKGGYVTLDSILLIDKDDQAQAIDLIFLDANGSVGAEDATVAPTDAVAGTIVGMYSIVAADYVDLANNQVVDKRDLRIRMKLPTTSLWFAAVCRSGTPTYTATGLVFKLGFRYD